MPIYQHIAGRGQNGIGKNGRPNGSLGGMGGRGTHGGRGQQGTIGGRGGSGGMGGRGIGMGGGMGAMGGAMTGMDMSQMRGMAGFQQGSGGTVRFGNKVIRNPHEMRMFLEARRKGGKAVAGGDRRYFNIT